VERLVAVAAMQTREIVDFLPRAGKPMAATIQAWGSYATAARRGKTCGGCNLSLQYECGKLCKCCHKWENLRRLQYTNAGNYATASLRGKTFGGCITNVVNYETADISGKTCCGCNRSAGTTQLLPCAAKPLVAAI